MNPKINELFSLLFEIKVYNFGLSPQFVQTLID